MKTSRREFLAAVGALAITPNLIQGKDVDSFLEGDGEDHPDGQVLAVLEVEGVPPVIIHGRPWRDFPDDYWLLTAYWRGHRIHKTVYYADHTDRNKAGWSVFWATDDRGTDISFKARAAGPLQLEMGWFKVLSIKLPSPVDWVE
jgi:hypothetical protein